MNFVERVIIEIDAGKYERAFDNMKPTVHSGLFSVDFDTRYGSDDDCWSVHLYEGFLFEYCKLSRGTLASIPLTFKEKRRLFKAFMAAIKREKIKYAQRLQLATQ
jgi:hypothetical protein